MNVFEYWGVTKELPKQDGSSGRFKFHETIKTKSTRNSKVTNLIELDMSSKYGVKIEHLEDFGFRKTI
jgi:hypothetical protein